MLYPATRPSNKRLLLAAAAGLAVLGVALTASEWAVAGGACCSKGAGAATKAQASARAADYTCSIPAGCVMATGAGAGCCAGKAAALRALQLTDSERKVVDYVVAGYRAEGRHDFSAREIQDKTGIELTAEMKGRVLGATYAELLADASPAAAALAPLMGCEACPSGGDLVLSTPEELALIQTELAQDGVALQGFEAPDFTLRDLDGHKVHKDSFRGKAVALAFWSPTCEHSLQNLIRLQETGAASRQDLAVVAVACSDNDRGELRKFVKSAGLNVPVYVSADGDVRETYQAHVVPTVVLINREGEMVKRLVGVKSQTDLAAELASLGG